MKLKIKIVIVVIVLLLIGALTGILADYHCPWIGLKLVESLNYIFDISSDIIRSVIITIIVENVNKIVRQKNLKKKKNQSKRLVHGKKL